MTGKEKRFFLNSMNSPVAIFYIRDNGLEVILSSKENSGREIGAAEKENHSYTAGSSGGGLTIFTRRPSIRRRLAAKSRMASG